MRRTCWVLRDTFFSLPYAELGWSFRTEAPGLEILPWLSTSGGGGTGGIGGTDIGADGVSRLPSLVNGSANGSANWSVLHVISNMDISTAIKHVIAISHVFLVLGV